MNKHFREIITHKALEFKLSGVLTGSLADDLIASKPELANQFKNVCAPIPLALVERLENTLNTLNLTKREFLTQAVISALDEAEAIMEEIDITEYFREEADTKAKEAA